MDTIVLLKQMLVLLAMMIIGFAVVRAKLIDRLGAQRISTLVVKVLNPFLIISGVLGKQLDHAEELVVQNLILVTGMYVGLMVISWLYVRLRRFSDKERCQQQLMLIFSNVGFMGIPLVKAMYGDVYVIFVAFYILAYNILFYTYGIYLASGISDAKTNFSPKKILNTGSVASAIAILLFAFHIPVNSVVASICDDMGNACVPLAMMTIGMSVAQMSLKNVLSHAESYVILAVKMLILPIAAALLMRNLPLDENVRGIFFLTLSMPIGSMVGILAQEYGGDGDFCNCTTALTTVAAALTVPIVSLFY